MNLAYRMLKCFVNTVFCFLLSDILTCVDKPNLEAGLLECGNEIP